MRIFFCAVFVCGFWLFLGTLEWRRVIVEGESPVGRSGHVVAIVDKKMYMFGGQGGDKQMLGDLWVLHLSKCKYDKLAASDEKFSLNSRMLVCVP